MTTVTQFHTARDLSLLPRGRGRHELIRGELRTLAPAGFEHGAVNINLAIPLGQHIKARDLGVLVGAETGFLLERDPETVRAPDLGFVSKERIALLGLPRQFFPGAPDLTVEIVSPNDSVPEVEEKVWEWLAASARLVWVVNPRQRSVTVHDPGAATVVLGADDVLDGGEVVPGFRLKVGESF